MLQLCALGLVVFIYLKAAQHLCKLRMLYPLYLDRFALNYTSHKHYHLSSFKQLAKVQDSQHFVGIIASSHSIPQHQTT